MTKDINDFIASAREELSAYERQLDGFRAEATQSAARRAEVETRLVATYGELASSLAPTLDAVAAQELARRLGSAEIQQAFASVESRVLTIQTRLAEIEATPDYARRDSLEPQLRGEIADVAPDRQKLSDEIRRLEAHEGFRDLAARRYGTPGYPHNGWRRYVRREALRDWKCADRITEAEGVADVLEVLLRYEELQRRLAPLAAEVTEDQAHLAAIADLQQEHAILSAELTGAPDRARTEVGEKAANALLGAATAQQPTGSQANNPGSPQLVTIDGMRHQVAYLAQLEAQLQSEQADISGRAAKLRAESSKYQSDRYRYRNKRFSEETFGKRFGRAQRWDGRLNRYRSAGTTVYEFNSYDRGSYMGDLLWWDVMTDGRINGSFIPDVDEYRRHNPSYVYHRSYATTMRSDDIDPHIDTTDHDNS